MIFTKREEMPYRNMSYPIKDWLSWLLKAKLDIKFSNGTR